MNPINHEILWGMLLQLRSKVRSHADGLTHASIVWYGPYFEIHLNSIPEFTSDVKAIIFTSEPVLEYPGITSFLFSDNYSIRLHNNNLLTPGQVDFLELYLPLCFSAPKASLIHRSVSILHMAQSLDGRIATETGHSKWIGNQENLVHSHRIRSLCDAILIGARTLELDKPALNVRHVNGPDPVKVVVGNKLYDFKSLLNNSGKVLFFTANKDIKPECVECVYIPAEENRIPPRKILEVLYQRGINSVFVEGGSITGSLFLAGQAVDILQLFLAPKILGSGICDFVLPSISDIGESIEFVNGSFKPMGDGILFEGEVSYQNYSHDRSGVLAYQQ